MIPLLLATLLAAPTSHPYQPMGAPADPKVAVRWDRYHDYEEVVKILKELAALHPQRARLQSLGRSYAGREMWLLRVTSFGTGDDRGKPAFWIDGAIHANEIQASEVALYTAWYLLEMYGRAEGVTALVDRCAFYILPMINPDTRDAHMYQANSTHSPRSGLVPVDNDNDGLFDEDGPDDLDGDGNITQMRVADPNGRWKPHPDYPNLMIRARDDEPGQYRLLGSEGYDNDGDGRIDEDEPGGYDPNRDWGWNWQPHYVQHGAYRYPFSLPENRLAADFVLDHPNIAGAQSYHNAGGMILRGPGTKEDQYESSDAAVFDTIGRQGEKLLPGYRYLQVGRELYEICGGEFDWFYQMRGVFFFTNELFTPRNLFQRALGDRHGREEDFHAFNKYLLFGEGLVPWHEVEHPQFGKIEVGGLKKNWGRQPPSFLLEEECHRNMAFTFYHAEQMPLLVIQETSVRRLADDLREVTITLANRRVIPTRAAVDLRRKITRPDLVTLAGDGIKVLAGFHGEDRYFQSPKEQKEQPQTLNVPQVPGMGAVYLRWLVQGPGAMRIDVDSLKGGRLTKAVP